MQKLTEPRTKIQVSLTPELLHSVKVTAAAKELNLREAISEALTVWVGIQKVNFLDKNKPTGVVKF